MAGMMIGKGRRLLAAIGLTGALLLGGCAYDDGYGYGGVNVGSGYYGGGSYYDDYYPGSYGGWYNDYYYPGSGYYVYDRGGRRQRWNNGQRSYWEGRRSEWRKHGNGGRPNRPPTASTPSVPNPQWQGRPPTASTPSVPNQQWQGRPRPSSPSNDGRQGWRADRRSGQSVGQPSAQPSQPSVQRDAPRQSNRGWRGRNGTPRNPSN